MSTRWESKLESERKMSLTFLCEARRASGLPSHSGNGYYIVQGYQAGCEYIPFFQSFLSSFIAKVWRALITLVLHGGSG